MSCPRPRCTRLGVFAALAVLSSASFGAPSAGAAGARAGTVSSQTEAAADRAQVQRATTQRLLAGRRRHLARCVARHPNRCARWQTSLERTERRLGLAETRVLDMREAPFVTLSAQTLSWAPITGVSDYILKRRSPGGHQNRLVVFGTSVTPPPIPGETVEYFVRTAAYGSEWSTVVSITYATSPPLPGA